MEIIFALAFRIALNEITKPIEKLRDPTASLVHSQVQRMGQSFKIILYRGSQIADAHETFQLRKEARSLALRLVDYLIKMIKKVLLPKLGAELIGSHTLEVVGLIDDQMAVFGEYLRAGSHLR